MDVQRITELLESEELAGIALDTSEFEAQGMKFESGLLAQMDQFSESRITFLISDVVWREVRSHLVARTSDAQNGLVRALRKAASLWDFDDKVHDSIATTLFGEKSPDAQVDMRLQKYAETTGMSILSADEYVDLKELLHLYFCSRPPFDEKVATRKNEFPDAIALLSLEAWARNNDVYVLVVSRDSDWSRFCQQTERLIPIDDLAQALSYFQLRTKAYAVCRAFSLSYEGELPYLAGEIESLLRHRLWEQIQFDIEASSDFLYEYEVCDIVMNDYRFTTIGENGEIVVPIRYDSAKVVVAAEIELDLLVDMQFSFSVRDSIDKDYISLGVAPMAVETEVTVECLLTLEGDFETDHQKFSLTEFEVKPTRKYLEVGEIKPDWMHSEPHDVP